jgi:ATP synthase protein I
MGKRVYSLGFADHRLGLERVAGSQGQLMSDTSDTSDLPLPPSASQRDAWRDTLWPDQEPEPPVRPLTREEAQALIARHPQISIWRVIAMQVLSGVLVALVWWVLSSSQSAAVSALYGMAVVVVPNVLMARALLGSRLGRSVGGLVLWELLKIAVVGAMLASAPRLIAPVSWPALLVAMVLGMKVYVVALLWQSRRSKI